MGFLKFLKRDKKKGLDLETENLDVPPAPPDFEEKPGELPELPEIPELPELPELEPISELQKKPEGILGVPDILKEFPSTKEKPIPEFKAPKIPPARVPEPIPKEPIGPIPIETPKPLFGIREPEKQKPIIKEDIPIHAPKLDIKPEISPYEIFERAAVREEGDLLAHKEAKSPIFIRVDRFRNILTGISTIKSKLKMANESLIKLNEIDENRDKEFEKWRNVIVDLQKKLIFIDKTLFKR